jgi:leucyl aminopeptidase
MQKIIIIYILGIANLLLVTALEGQLVLPPISEFSEVLPQHGDHSVDESMLAAIQSHPDPVAAYLSLQNENTRADTETKLAEPRLLHIMGAAKPVWMTEGDKMRLRRKATKFMDITEHEAFYAKQPYDAASNKPSELPCKRAR